MSNTKTKLILTLNDKALLDEWKKAKENEKGWQDIRRDLEARMLDDIGEEKLEELFSEMTTMSKSVNVEDIADLKLAFDRKLDDMAINELVMQHPALLGTVFKVVYEQISNRVLDKAAAQDTPIGQALTDSFEDVRKNIYFSLRK